MRRKYVLFLAVMLAVGVFSGCRLQQSSQEDLKKVVADGVKEGVRPIEQKVDTLLGVTNQIDSKVDRNDKNNAARHEQVMTSLKKIEDCACGKKPVVRRSAPKKPAPKRKPAAPQVAKAKPTPPAAPAPPARVTPPVEPPPPIEQPRYQPPPEPPPAPPAARVEVVKHKCGRCPGRRGG